MGLFTFGNLLTEEKVSSPVSVNQPRTINRNEPSFKELVSKVVNKDVAVDAKTDTSKIATPEPVAITKKEKISPENNLLQAPKEPIQIEFKPALKLELPKSQEPQVPKVKDGQLEVKKPEEIKSEEDLLGGQTEGTFFLKTLLSEFSDVLSAGNELEKLTNKSNKVGEEKNNIKREFAELSPARQEIAAKLSKLLSEENNSSEVLKEVEKAYNNYLDEFELKYKEKLDGNSSEQDEIAKKISVKRAQISALVKRMGGQESFNQIKAIVSFCKEQRKANLEGKYKDVDEAIKQDVQKFVTGFVEGDLHGAVMLAQGNDLIGILMRVYGAPEKDKNNYAR